MADWKPPTDAVEVSAGGWTPPSDAIQEPDQTATAVAPQVSNPPQAAPMQQFDEFGEALASPAPAKFGPVPGLAESIQTTEAPSPKPVVQTPSKQQLNEATEYYDKWAQLDEKQLAAVRQNIEAEKLAMQKIATTLEERKRYVVDDASLTAYNSMVETYNDLAKKSARDEYFAAMRDYDIKAGKGNMAAGVYRQMLTGTGKALAGVVDVLSTPSPSAQLDRYINQALGDSNYESPTEKSIRFIEEAPVKYSGLAQYATPEYIERQSQKTIPGAILGLAEFAPVAAGSFVAGPEVAAGMAFSQQYREAKNQMSGPEWDTIPEYQKDGFAMVSGVVSATLNTMGLEGLAGKLPFVNNIAFNVLKKTLPGMSAGEIRKIVDAETQSAIANATSRMALGAGVEAVEEPLDYLSQELLMHEFENLHDNDKLFRDNAESFSELANGVIRSAEMGAIGGGFLGSVPAMGAAMKTGSVTKNQTDKQYELMEKMVLDPQFEDAFKRQSEGLIAEGKLSRADYEKSLDDLSVARKIAEKLPEDLEVGKRKEAFDLLLEKERLSKKEKSLVADKIEAINQKLSNIAGQGAKMAAKPVSEEELDANIGADEERDALIKMRNERGVFFDPMDDLPDQVVRTMNRIDANIPVSNTSLEEVSNWLYNKRKQVAAIKSDPNRMMTIEQVDALVAQIDEDINSIEIYKYEQREPGSTKPEENYIPAQAQPSSQVADGANAQAAPDQDIVTAVKEGVDLTDDQLKAIADNPELLSAVNNALSGMRKTSPSQGSQLIGRDEEGDMIEPDKQGRMTDELALKLINGIVRGYKIVRHKTDEDLQKARQAKQGTTKDVDGFIDRNDKEIHIGPNGRAGRVLAHEAMHPVVDAIVKKLELGDATLAEMYSEMSQDPRLIGFEKFGAKYVKDMTNGDDAVLGMTEAITDYLGAIANGDFDSEFKSNSKFLDAVKDLLERIKAWLGIDINIDSIDNLKDMAAAVHVASKYGRGLKSEYGGAGSGTSPMAKDVFLGQEFLDAVRDGRMDDAKKILAEARQKQRAEQEAKQKREAKKQYSKGYKAGEAAAKKVSKEKLKTMKEEFSAKLEENEIEHDKDIDDLIEQFRQEEQLSEEEAQQLYDSLAEENEKLKQQLKSAASDAVRAFAEGVKNTKAGVTEGIKIGFKAWRDGSKAMADAMREVIAKHQKDKGVLSAAKARAILRKAMTVKPNDAESLANFEQYLDRVFSDMVYAQKISSVEKAQRQVRKKKHGPMNEDVRAFTKVDPTLMSDAELSQYLAALDDMRKRVPNYTLMNQMDVSGFAPVTKHPFDAVATSEELTKAKESIDNTDPKTVEEFVQLLKDGRAYVRAARRLADNKVITDEQADDLVAEVAKNGRELREKYAKEMDAFAASMIPSIRTAAKDAQGVGDKPENNLLEKAMALTDAELKGLDPTELVDLENILLNAQTSGYVDVMRLVPIVDQALAGPTSTKLAEEMSKVNEDKKLEEKLGRNAMETWSQSSGIEYNQSKATALDKAIVHPVTKADDERIRFTRKMLNDFWDAAKKAGFGAIKSPLDVINLFKKKEEVERLNRIGMVIRYLNEYYSGLKDNSMTAQGRIGTRDLYHEDVMSKAPDNEYQTASVEKKKQLETWKNIHDSFPKKDGRVSPEDVYNSFMANDGKFLSKEDRDFAQKIMDLMQDNLAPRQKFSNALRGTGFESVEAYAPQVRIIRKPQESVPSHKGKGTAVREASVGKERTSKDIRLWETNIAELFGMATNKVATQFYMGQAVNAANEVFNEAMSKAKSPREVYSLRKFKDAMNKNVEQAFRYRPLDPLSKSLRWALNASSIRIQLSIVKAVGEVLSYLAEGPARAGGIKVYAKTAEQIMNKVSGSARVYSDAMRRLGSVHIADTSEMGNAMIYDGVITRASTIEKVKNWMASLPSKVFIPGQWATVFEGAFADFTGGKKLDWEKLNTSAVYRQENAEAIREALALADVVIARIKGTETAVAKARNIQVGPLSVDARSYLGMEFGFMTGYVNKQRLAMLASILELARSPSIQNAGGMMRVVAGITLGNMIYAMFQEFGYSGRQWLSAALGDDEDKKKEAEAKLKAMLEPKKMAIEAATQLGSGVATYGAGVGRHAIRLAASLVPELMTMTEEEKDMLDNATRNLTYMSSDIYGTPKQKAQQMIAEALLPQVDLGLRVAGSISTSYKAVAQEKSKGGMFNDTDDAIALAQAAMTIINFSQLLRGQYIPQSVPERAAASLIADDNKTTPEEMIAKARGFKAGVMKGIEDAREKRRIEAMDFWERVMDKWNEK